MYCPKCSTQNQDDLAYCRGCGENLLVISQALKKHLSIALVSKLDAVIEKKNELFRRDAILNGLMGAAFLFSTVLAPLGARFYTLFNVSFLLLGIFALLSGAWNFLA